MIADDPGLLAAAQAGDERAFRALVEPHARAIEVHCYRMLGSLQDAEDVTQETLLRAWAAIDRFGRRASLGTWLYRIATNACLDELERRPRRPEAVDPYPDARLAGLPSQSADPAARYADREGMELAFLTAIQRLPARQRATLIFRDVLGMHGDEAADLLGTTVAAANSALQRARTTIEREAPARSVANAGPQARALLARYVEAWERADVDGLVALLREDALMTMPPQRVVAGARAIVGFFAGAASREVLAAATASATWANGRPAVLLWRTDEAHPDALLALDLHADGRVAAITVTRDLGVLARFHAPLEPTDELRGAAPSNPT